MRWTNSYPSLHYVISGHGSPLLLMHELGGSLLSWDVVADRTTPYHRVIRYDQRGAGWSEKTRTPYAQADLVDDALRVLDAANEGRPVIAGAVASTCATACELARRAPDRIAGLVLLSPGFGVEGTARDLTLARADLTERQGMAAVVDLAMERIYPAAIRDDRFAAYRARFLAADPYSFALGNRAFAETSVELEAISAPTLLAPGALDVRPLAAAEEACARLPCGALTTIADAGHVPHVQNPAAVTQLILEFARAAAMSPGGSHATCTSRGLI